MIDSQQEQILEPDFNALDNWWRVSTAQIYQQQRLIHSVEFDSEVLYSNYENFLVENMNRVQTVNIRTLTVRESIIDTENSLKDYLDRFIPEAFKISQHFYGDLTEEHWGRFSDFIGGLDWILKALSFETELYKIDRTNPPGYLLLIDNLSELVAQLGSALENMDLVTVGDLMQYELVPLLQKIQRTE